MSLEDVYCVGCDTRVWLLSVPPELKDNSNEVEELRKWVRHMCTHPHEIGVYDYEHDVRFVYYVRRGSALLQVRRTISPTRNLVQFTVFADHVIVVEGGNAVRKLIFKMTKQGARSSVLRLHTS